MRSQGHYPPRGDLFRTKQDRRLKTTFGSEKIAEFDRRIELTVARRAFEQDARTRRASSIRTTDDSAGTARQHRTPLAPQASRVTDAEPTDHASKEGSDGQVCDCCAIGRCCGGPERRCRRRFMLLDFSSPYCGPCQAMIPTDPEPRSGRLPDPQRRHDARAATGSAVRRDADSLLHHARRRARDGADRRRDERRMQLVAMFQRAMQAAHAVAGSQQRQPADWQRLQPAHKPASVDPWSGVGGAAAACGSQTVGGTDAPARDR